MAQGTGGAAEEIDLVDLAIALWRRKGMIVIVALAVVVVATVFAVHRAAQAPTRAYTSIYALPTVLMRSPNGGGVADAMSAIMPTAELIALAQSVYVPAAETSMSQQGVSVGIDSPKDTRLIELKTTLTATQNQSVVATLHKQVLTQMRDEINVRIKALKESGKDTTTEARVPALSVSPGHIVMLAKETTTRKPSKTVLIIALGAILGVSLGVFVALFVGFWASVRQRMSAQSRTN